MSTPATAPSYEHLNAQQQEALDRLVAARAAGTPSAIRSAEQDVVCEHLGFATALGNRYRSRGVDQDDLQQLARLGLIKAVKRWQPDLGSEFLPFAYPTILGELKRYFRDHSAMIRPPRTLRDLNSEVQIAGSNLEQRLGRPATNVELAEAVGVPLNLIQEQNLAMSNSRSLSLDVQAIQRAADQLPSASALSALEKVENQVMAKHVIAGLTDRERRILSLRYLEGKSQGQIGTAIGVSQMQVSRLLRELLNKLRIALNDDDAASGSTGLRSTKVVGNKSRSWAMAG